MSAKPVYLPQFSKISQTQWQEIVDQTMAKFPLEPIRATVGNILSMYAGWARAEPGVGFVNLATPLNGEIAPDVEWQRHDLETEHRGLAKAARAMLAAYAPHLEPGWHDLVQEADWDRDFRVSAQALIDKLKAIAENSERRANEIADEKRGYHEKLKYLHQRKNNLGRPIDSPFEIMIEDMITAWCHAGGRVGASGNNGYGGPLVRFLRASAGLVLRAPPKVGAVQGWIRKFQREQKSNSAPMTTTAKGAAIPKSLRAVPPAKKRRVAQVTAATR
jgi:hypothetical protein